MATTPEAKVKRKVVDLLKANGVYYFFPATHGYGRSGVPDVVCCVNGKFLGVECKAGDSSPTALQHQELDAIRRAGGTAVVINEDNITMLYDLIRVLKQP
jgi:Holliday junction resolvase